MILVSLSYPLPYMFSVLMLCYIIIKYLGVYLLHIPVLLPCNDSGTLAFDNKNLYT